MFPATFAAMTPDPPPIQRKCLVYPMSIPSVGRSLPKPTTIDMTFSVQGKVELRGGFADAFPLHRQRIELKGRYGAHTQEYTHCHLIEHLGRKSDRDIEATTGERPETYMYFSLNPRLPKNATLCKLALADPKTSHMLRGDVVIVRAACPIWVLSSYDFDEAKAPIEFLRNGLKDQVNYIDFDPSLEALATSYILNWLESDHWANYERYEEEWHNVRTFSTAMIKQLGLNGALAPSKEVEKAWANTSRRNAEAVQKIKRDGNADARCVFCGTIATAEDSLKWCACRLVRYCNSGCQQQDWKAHKKECKQARRTI